MESSAKTRPPSKRAITDATATEKILKVHEENNSVHGSLNVWAHLRRQGGGGPRHPLMDKRGYPTQSTSGDAISAALTWLTTIRQPLPVRVKITKLGSAAGGPVISRARGRR